MINVSLIEDIELKHLFDEYENSLTFLRNPPYYIDNLNDYSFYISRLLKTIQGNDDSIYQDLKRKIEANSSLEEMLLNHGNNISTLPEENNPKLKLFDIVKKLLHENKKSKTLLDRISEERRNNKEALIICNSYDEDFFKDYLRINNYENCEAVRYKKLLKKKESELEGVVILGYFLEGYRDFEIYYNFSTVVNLLLYDFENELYKDCLNKYKTKLEIELESEDRLFICGIKYEKPPELPITLNQSLQSIIDNVKNLSDKDFDEYIEDPESNTNEIIEYTLEYEGNYETDSLKSTDTVFDQNNHLKRVNRLKNGEIIRVYNLDFRENLVETATEFQSDKFHEIDRHSNLWRSVLKNLYYKRYQQNLDLLHRDLKRHGLTVLPSTIDNNWISGKTKFPMRKKDLKALYELSKDMELGASMGMLLESKRVYTSILISLGRDLKDEIKIFLIDGTMGEIILQNNISAETLRKTITEQMPLKKIKKITSRIIKAEEFDD